MDDVNSFDFEVSRWQYEDLYAAFSRKITFEHYFSFRFFQGCESRDFEEYYNNHLSKKLFERHAVVPEELDSWKLTAIAYWERSYPAAIETRLAMLFKLYRRTKAEINHVDYYINASRDLAITVYFAPKRPNKLSRFFLRRQK